MKKISIIITLFSLVFLTSCQKENKVSQKTKPVENSRQQYINNQVHNVKVIKKKDAANYSYIKVSEAGNEFWIASNVIDAVPGDELTFSQSMEMRNFESKSLNKTFDKILFVQDIRKANQPVASFKHPQVSTKKKDVIHIAPLKNGYSIADIYKKKNNLTGKTVKVKGKVTKFNPDIMGRNWIHIQDGTNFNNNFDLLITSNQAVKLGDVITAEGKVVTDKDFGAGYKYSVLLEEASLSVQK